MKKIKHITVYIVAILCLTVCRIYPGLLPENVNKYIPIIICCLAAICLLTLIRLGRNLVAICIGFAAFCIYGLDSLNMFGLNAPSLLEFVKQLLQKRIIS